MFNIKNAYYKLKNYILKYDKIIISTNHLMYIIDGWTDTYNFDCLEYKSNFNYKYISVVTLKSPPTQYFNYIGIKHNNIIVLGYDYQYLDLLYRIINPQNYFLNT